jgi:hypothetical protein
MINYLLIYNIHIQSRKEAWREKGPSILYSGGTIQAV